VTPSIEWVTAWPGVEIAVRAGDEHLTGWVLREQGRWFEGELPLLARLLAPGARFVDVGANAGVYALAAARLVGPEGRVFAFEPSPGAAELLREGARRNGLDWVVVRGEALSDQEGEAHLWLDEATELSSLLRSPSVRGAARRVSVPLSRLDALREALGMSGVDLIKIDAEGAEEKIVLGARALLAESEPLVLHEIKRGKEVDLSLATRLGKMGYAPYRHLPGLDVLVPFSPGGFLDPYQLNLFAASPARAAALAAKGILAEGAGEVPAVDAERGARRLARFPYARWLAPRWQGAPSADGRLWTALSLHAFAHEEASAPAATRWAALEKALSLSLERVNERPTAARLLTAGRLAWEVGARALAVRTLKDAIAALRSGDGAELDEPFACPEPAWEERPPRGPVEGLALAAALSRHERLRAFSSFFTGLDGLEDLRLFALLGYPDDEMGRRLSLLERRAEVARTTSDSSGNLIGAGCHSP
jgi:FkbM family methyltransferase